MSLPKWDAEKVESLYEQPFLELLFQAQAVHRANFRNDEIELCSLLSVKTGACPEDCAYCPQSGHYQTEVKREKLMDLKDVITQAKAAKEGGATRFCMGAAWKRPPKKELPKVMAMIEAVKSLGLETCVTLGSLDEEEAQQLKAAGLDFYNHNLDTSPTYYTKIITTRTYEERLETLKQVQQVGIKVCCGGIVGMGESRRDRIDLLLQLATLPEPPKSVPINRLIPFQGTPLELSQPIDNIEFIRTIAIARLLMPASIVRLSAGRIAMSEEMQILCFMAGANSMWLGDKLLVAQNPERNQDMAMLQRLGMKINA
jgi:biotin synthase